MRESDDRSHRVSGTLCLSFFVCLLIFRQYSQKKGRYIKMAEKKLKPIDLKNLEPEEKLKYEIAEELGLLDKVMAEGWRSLSSKETGRIGGLITKRKRKS